MIIVNSLLKVMCPPIQSRDLAEAEAEELCGTHPGGDGCGGLRGQADPAELDGAGAAGAADGA